MSLMTEVLIKKGNLDADVCTGRRPCEQYSYAALSWERGLLQTLA